MIIFTILGIITAIFLFTVILMSIIETRIKNRTKEKFLWNMDKVETANIRGQASKGNRTYNEILKRNGKKTQ